MIRNGCNLADLTFHIASNRNAVWALTNDAKYKTPCAEKNSSKQLILS